MNRFNMHILFKVVMFVGISCSGLAQTSKEYFHSVGDTVILFCTLQKEGDPIVWTFQFNTTERIQYSTGIRTNPNLEGISNRLSVVGNFDLQISTIRKEDEGTYICQTNINGMMREHLAILSIVTPPTNLSMQNVKDGKVSGTEGHILSLNCIVEGGKPPPEVKLTVSSVNVSVTGNQSVLYTNPQVTRNFDKQTATCTVDHLGSLSLFKKTAMVYLDLKPLKPTFSQTSISTEETIPLTASCTSEGSRPPASYQWYIGSTNVTTFAKDTSVYIKPTETYKVNSILTYNVNRSYNGKEVTCKVTNIADLIGTQDRKQLDVKYAPDIIVNSRNYTQSEAIRSVTCNPSGNPDSYTYDKWQHRSRYGQLIREFNGNKTLRLPDTSNEFKRYQDSGEYICIASNGIKDKGNKFEQTGSVFLIVEAQPVFTSDTIDKVKLFGEIGKAIDIYVNVYSVPQLTSYMWARIGKPITTQKSSSSPTTVQDKIYGEEVQLDGYNVTLTILNLKSEDFTNYTVSLTNAFGTVELTIELESASRPEMPGNFSNIASSSTSITVQWDPNSGGGYKQIFYIQYRVQGSSEWTIVSAGEEDIDEQKRRRTYEVKQLQGGTAYELIMFAENTAMKRSNFTEVLIELTRSSDAGSSTGAVIGGVAGSLIGVIIVLLVIVCVLKKRKERANPSMKLRTNLEAEDDDGLKDNILYESSQSDGLKKNVLYQSAGPDFESQNKTSSSSEYAVVHKPNAIYAEVNKDDQPKKAKAKKQKDQKEKPKKAKKVKAKALNNNPEEEYANSALPLQNLKEGEYANSTDTQGPSGHHTNAQGLEYADLTFRQIPEKNKKQVIHGNDERTLYADVDHTKKAPPPPPESEYEETNIKHGKIT